METQPEPLSVFAAEEIKTEETGISSPKTQKNIEVPPAELLPTEEEQKKIMLEEAMKILGRYVAPHDKKARWVKKEDLPRVLEEANMMAKLIGTPRGIYGRVSALAHTQIDDKDPLRFFFTANGMVVINPILLRHTNYPIMNPEGCMTYPEEPMQQLVKRYHKVDVAYQTLLKDGDKDIEISGMLTAKIKGFEARMWQHEVQHLNGFYIYGEHQPEQAIGFGDGVILEQEALDKLYTNNG